MRYNVKVIDSHLETLTKDNNLSWSQALSLARRHGFGRLAHQVVVRDEQDVVVARGAWNGDRWVVWVVPRRCR